MLASVGEFGILTILATIHTVAQLRARFALKSADLSVARRVRVAFLVYLTLALFPGLLTL